ncbi:nuclear transport factor 2 family protein [Rhodobacteraceae bacterium NNCM2]|nr:nuclear transport factor 2 family protein [Coraliihabitans acroporae]
MASPIADRILEMISTHDPSGLEETLHPEVIFRPPTYWAEWQGREVVAVLLGHVAEVFTDFRYRRTWSDGPNHALEFEAKVGGLDIVGVDLITTDAAGLITEFEVVARPYKSVGALREAMMARVMKDPRMMKFAK